MCHFRGSSKRDTKRPSQGLSPEVSCASGEEVHSSQREQLKRSLRGREVPGNSEAAWHIGVLWTETGGTDLGQNKGTGAPARELREPSLPVGQSDLSLNPSCTTWHCVSLGQGARPSEPLLSVLPGPSV